MSAILTTPVCCSWQFTGKDRWGHIWKRTVAKSQTNATNVTASSQASHLRRHFKTHSGEKSNKCNQCDYASSWVDALITHSGEKTNKCNQCDFASSQARLLSQHLKTHSGEKPNKCIPCDFACSRPSFLRIHMKKHRQMYYFFSRKDQVAHTMALL